MDKKANPRMPQNETRAAILKHLLEGNLSALDLEEKLGINESAVRRHLDNLEQQEYVEHYFEKASRGRPKKLYTLTSEGRKVFPQRMHMLFVMLVQRVREERGEEELEELLSRVASDFAEELSPNGSDMSGEDRLGEFMDSLEEFGFYPDLSKHNGSYRIKYRNCVFGNAIEGLCEPICDKLCVMHREKVRNVIPGCEVEQEKSVAEGDDFCVQRVSLGG